VALLNPSGWGNLGDAAIIESAKEGLRAASPWPCRFLLITLNPFDSAQRHAEPAVELSSRSKPKYPVATRSFWRLWQPVRPGAPGGPSGNGLDAYPWIPYRVRKWINACLAPTLEVAHFLVCLRYMARTHLLVIAGGGQLDDYWGGARGHPLSLWKWSLAAALCRTRIVFASVGAGTIRTRGSEYFLRSALARARYVSVRDPRSLQTVRTTLNCPQATLVPDMAFHLQMAAQWRADLTKQRQQRHGTVTVSPIAWRHPRLWPDAGIEPYTRYIDKLSAAIAALLDDGIAVRIIRSDTADVYAVDDLVAAITARRPNSSGNGLHRIDTDTIDTFLSQVGESDMLIASRLHSVILAQACGVAVVAISYDWKVDEQMKACHTSERTVQIDTFSTEELLTLARSQLGTDRPDRPTPLPQGWPDELARQFASLVA